jgi:hypothetical protein
MMQAICSVARLVCRTVCAAMGDVLAASQVLYTMYACCSPTQGPLTLSGHVRVAHRHVVPCNHVVTMLYTQLKAVFDVLSVLLLVPCASLQHGGGQMGVAWQR